MIFDRCFAFADGDVLGMSSGGSLEGQGDPLPVDTMGQEFAGVTPVPKHMMLSVDSFVPPSGFEFDAFKKWVETTEITFKLQFPGSNKFLTTKGYIQAPSLKWGAADHTTISWRAMVQAVPFS